MRLASEDQGQLQGERLARVGRGEMGQVGHLTQAVAHRVGVDEERASGGLERLSVLEVRREGVDERALGPGQRPVDRLDEVPARVAVAGQDPLREQVVAGDWPGCVRPIA